MFASSFVVKIEPAPCDLVFFLVLTCFLFSGLRISKPVIVIGLLLLIYNFAATVSYIPVMDKPRTGMFVITSIYMSVSALLIGMLVSQDATSRYRTIALGWLTGASIGSAVAIAGFFNVGGLYDSLTVASRATGLFKDPNVFSTWLNFPIVFLLQNLLVGGGRHRTFKAALLLLMLAALFLAFSRGAWASVGLSVLMLFGLTFLFADDNRLRLRVIFTVVGGALAVAVLIAVLLSIPAIQDLFRERASLSQSYDVGETGRFGAQINSIPLLLERPLGFGPLQYSTFMGLDPHNTFLNAFASYGWLGGVTYLTMIVMTLSAGVRTIFVRGPWQPAAIAVFCSMSALILQGVQIDTDHWRHFYWLVGLTWGLFGATFAQRIVLQTRSKDLTVPAQ